MTQYADIQVTYTQETKNSVEVEGDTPLDFYKVLIMKQIEGEKFVWSGLPVEMMTWKFDKHPRQWRITLDTQERTITYIEHIYKNQPIEKVYRW